MVDAKDSIALDTGALDARQLNLILTHLPVDLTFVDEADEVRYFSAKKDRIFARAPGIIGKRVQDCHPAESVHVVNRILDEFKAGTRDEAEFWIKLGEPFVYIRYFALRDADGTYRGTLEVSQEVSGIRALEGERRLLDW